MSFRAAGEKSPEVGFEPNLAGKKTAFGLDLSSNSPFFLEVGRDFSAYGLEATSKEAAAIALRL
ncbi:MAG: hypothetical protein JW953_08055 [Anaerolineae bacterium]|nr:hypothetical protein [Anaerolineae bacterium]